VIAPFPYFGGKRSVARMVWERFGRPKQYIEPFFGSGAVLLAAPEPASLEVVNDASGFLANFWRAVKYQAEAVAVEADYPVSHIDLGARHRWLMDERDRVADGLQDPTWPGDARVAGWWLWGQCCWIGSGWCDWTGQIPHASNAGMGVQALGQIPHASNAGMGEVLWTSCGATAWTWLRKLAARLERVRITHGDWTRCLNHHYGADDTAVFLDPPYRAYEKLYGVTEPVADAVAAWAREHGHLRVALCGHVGDYDMPGWDVVQWDRGKHTYGGGKTTASECVWFSPACPDARKAPQMGLAL
jgi:hypothetical protein